MRREEKGRSHFRKRLFAVSLGLLFLILLIASFFGKNGWIEMSKSRKRQRALLSEIKRLEEKRSTLEREIEALKRDPKTMEKKAREKLWLMDPDELVIIKEKQNEKEKDK
ncbi:MAG: septum formation initiator family protein [Candidatus Aminicenantales bacterium]